METASVGSVLRVSHIEQARKVPLHSRHLILQYTKIQLKVLLILTVSSELYTDFSLSRKNSASLCFHRADPCLSIYTQRDPSDNAISELFLFLLFGILSSATFSGFRLQFFKADLRCRNLQLSLLHNHPASTNAHSEGCKY